MVHEFRPSGFGEAVLAFVLRATLKLLLKPVFSTRCSIGIQRRAVHRRPRRRQPLRRLSRRRPSHLRTHADGCSALRWVPCCLRC